MTLEEFKKYIDDLELSKSKFFCYIIARKLPGLVESCKYRIFTERFYDKDEQTRGLCIAYYISPYVGYWVELPIFWKNMIGNKVDHDNFDNRFYMTMEHFKNLEAKRKELGIGI